MTDDDDGVGVAFVGVCVSMVGVAALAPAGRVVLVICAAGRIEAVKEEEEVEEGRLTDERGTLPAVAVVVRMFASCRCAGSPGVGLAAALTALVPPVVAADPEGAAGGGIVGRGGAARAGAAALYAAYADAVDGGTIGAAAAGRSRGGE